MIFAFYRRGAGGINIGNYVHIAPFCSLIGEALIKLSDFSGLSSRVSIYSSSDDYSGAYITNPTVSNELTNVTSESVQLLKHVIIVAGSVILPGVTLAEGVAVGALSLVTKDCEEFSIYSGVPARKISFREQGLQSLELELSFKLDLNSQN